MKERAADLLRLTFGPFYSALKTLPKIASEPPYLPGAPRKPWLRRYAELVVSRFLTGSTNRFYNAYGLDLAGEGRRDPGGYLTERRFWRKIVARNVADSHNSTACLRNKLLFFFFCRGAGLPTPEVFAYSLDGACALRGRAIPFAGWKAALSAWPEPFFLKDACDCCARGVVKVVPPHANDAGRAPEDFLPDLTDVSCRGRTLICQAAIENCRELKALNPSSVNTIRILTVRGRSGDVALPCPPLLRVGASSRPVDNWAAGGLCVEVLGDGVLGRTGYYKPSLPRDSYTAERHPVSGIAFEGYRVPMFAESVSLAKRAHALLGDLTIVGWDVAVTPEGPVLIEGNDDPEISLHQIASGGLREKFRRMLEGGAE